MKTKSSGKTAAGTRLADGWIAVSVTPRAEEAVYGTFRSTRKESREALFQELGVSSPGGVKGTYEDIRVGTRRFRIVSTRINWWPVELQWAD